MYFARWDQLVQQQSLSKASLQLVKSSFCHHCWRGRLPYDDKFYEYCKLLELDPEYMMRNRMDAAGH